MLESLSTAKRFDLHVHTSRSDGCFEPDEVLRRAAKGGIDVLAITDHDLPQDLAPGPREIDGHPLHLLAGAELSGTYAGREIHLLVYLPGLFPTELRHFCDEAVAARTRRYNAAVDALGLEGLEHRAPDGVALTRYHLADALVAAGHARHSWEAFDRFLSHKHGLVPPIEVELVDALRAARAAGAVTSWAHPPLELAREHAAALVTEGLQGLELLRPRVAARDRRALRRLARDLGLFATGGSDWHGWTHPDDLGLFAVHRSELTDWLKAMAEAA